MVPPPRVAEIAANSTRAVNPSPRLTRLRRRFVDVRTALAMPRVDIVASRGAVTEDEMLRALRRPHPRYRVVGRKVVGAALIALEEFEDVDGYLASLKSARQRVRRARRLGYTAGLFDPAQRRAEMFAVNTSLP